MIVYNGYPSIHPGRLMIEPYYQSGVILSYFLSDKKQGFLFLNQSCVVIITQAAKCFRNRKRSTNQQEDVSLYTSDLFAFVAMPEVERNGIQRVHLEAGL
jgi:hypothetical protein